MPCYIPAAISAVVRKIRGSSPNSRYSICAAPAGQVRKALHLSWLCWNLSHPSPPAMYRVRGRGSTADCTAGVRTAAPPPAATSLQSWRNQCPADHRSAARTAMPDPATRAPGRRSVASGPTVGRITSAHGRTGAEQQSDDHTPRSILPPIAGVRRA